MKLRLILLLVSSAVSLLIPADRISNDKVGAWIPSPLGQSTLMGTGVNIHFTDAERGEIETIAAAGFHWVRMDLKWDVTEREPGRYDFSAYDRLLTSLERQNLQALLILDYGNPLYGDKPPRTREARAAFARWAVAAAKHFAGRNVIWELYNEPNVEIFWPPQPNVDEYIALALEVAKAFHTEAPGERLIGPATSGIDFPFLEACFRAGLLDYWSAVSVHPYRHTNPETAANEYRELRNLIDRYIPERGGKQMIPIISSEWGYSSAWPRMTDQRQSAIFSREMLTNIANGIPLSIWYDWRDDGLDPNEAEHHFGLVQHTSLQPKPAYLAAAVLQSFINGYTFDKRLLIGSSDDYLLSFRSGSSIRLAAWTTLPARHSVTVPLAAGAWKLTDITGSTRMISADSSGVVLLLSDAPVYLQR